MSIFKEEMTASEGVYINMREFSAYTIESKFPNVIDGLKPIHRRILLTFHRDPKSIKKEATIAGRVMEMHPHGDASISDAIAGLAKPYTNIVPLVESPSNLGTYDGEPPAAPRYVEVKHAETSDDLFFRHTERKSLRYQKCESEDGVEPVNFVPVIPTTLIFSVMGIGCGFKTETPAFNLAGVCQAARKYVELKYKYPDTYRKKALALAPYLLPDFPVACHLRNSRELIHEYRKGNFKVPIITDGTMEITKTKIIIKTLPPLKPFSKITADSDHKTHMEKSSWFHEHFTDAKDLGDNTNVGTYELTLRRGENPFDVLSVLRQQMQFSSAWTPSPLYYSQDEGMTSETPLSLIDKWSDARFKVVLGGLKQQLIDLQERYRHLMALSIVVDHAKDVCDIFCSSKDKEATVAIVANKYNLSYFQAKYLQKLPLEKLTSAGKQEILDELAEIRKKNNELQKKFSKIPEEMVEDIDYIDKKYSSKFPAKCQVKRFIGTACYKGTGWIMLESRQEVDEVLKRFDPDDISVNLFQEDGEIRTIGSDDPHLGPLRDVPKYFKASWVDRVNASNEYVAIRVKDGCTFVQNPKTSNMIDNCMTVVGKTCTIISRIEGRKIIKIDDKLVRQSVSVLTPSIKDVLFVSPITDDEVFVVHCNEKVSGVLNIDRISGEGRISRALIGKTHVIGVYRAGSPAMFTIPADISARTPIKHLYVKDLSDVVRPNSTTKILLTKKRTSDGRDLVQTSSRSSVYTVRV